MAIGLLLRFIIRAGKSILLALLSILLNMFMDILEITKAFKHHAGHDVEGDIT
jgi:hypothetical protein